MINICSCNVVSQTTLILPDLVSYQKVLADNCPVPMIYWWESQEWMLMYCDLCALIIHNFHEKFRWTSILQSSLLSISWDLEKFILWVWDLVYVYIPGERTWQNLFFILWMSIIIKYLANIIVYNCIYVVCCTFTEMSKNILHMSSS